jgi:hypothetical protein
MAIEWGSYEASGGLSMRVGINVITEAEILHNEIQCHYDVEYYTQNSAKYNNDAQTLNLSGDIGGSINFTNDQGANSGPNGNGVILRGTRSFNYQYGTYEYGDSSKTVSFGATLAGASNGITPSKTNSAQVPARPYGAPPQPFFQSATRNSDYSISLNWANPAGGPGEAPTGVYIDRFIENFQAQTVIGNVGGPPVTYTDGGMSPNKKSIYWIRTYNQAGASAYSQTNWVWTTPAVPSNCVRNTVALTQVITWTNNVNYAEYEIELHHAADGVWGAFVTLPAGTTSYTHNASSPGGAPSPTVKHTYGVRAHGTGDTSLYSGFVYSSESSGFTAAPSAPTNLAPTGSFIVDPVAPTVLTWQHNPTDGYDQTKYEIQHRVAGTTPWTSSGEVTSSQKTHTLAPSTYPESTDVEWQVRTWGVHATASPWSATATYQTADPIPIRYPMLLNLTTGRMEADATWTPASSAIEGGAGLTRSGDILNVNVDNASVEISSDIVRVKGNGIGTSHLADDAVTGVKILNGTIGLAELAAALTDGTAGSKQVRAIGSGATDVVAGNDARLTNARAPTAHSHVEADLPTTLATDAEVATAVSTHAAAADPHTGYQKESEKAAVNGYASLDGTTKVPIAQLPTGATGTTVPLGDHTHDTRYYTETEADALLAAKAVDTAVVHKTGDESIAGVKLFTDPLHFDEETTSPTSPGTGARMFTRAGKMWVKTPSVEYALGVESVAVSLLTNGDYESRKGAVGTEPTAWNGFWKNGDANTVLIQATDQAATGLGSAKVHLGATTTDQVNVQTDDSFPITPGGVLNVEFNARSGAQAGAQISIELQSSVDATGGAPNFFVSGTSTSSVGIVVPVNGWTHYVKQVVIPAGHTLARLVFRVMKNSAVVDAYTTQQDVWIDSAVAQMDTTTVDTLEWRNSMMAANVTLPTGAAINLSFPNSLGGSGVTINGSGQMVISTPGVYYAIATLGLVGTNYADTYLRRYRGGVLQESRNTVGSATGSGWDSVIVTGTFQCLTGDILAVEASSGAASVCSIEAARTSFVVNKLAGPGAVGPSGVKGDKGDVGYADMSVRCVYTGNAALTVSAPNVVDGLNLVVGDRVLGAYLAGTTGHANDGIYTVTTVGTGSNGVWARATDADAIVELYAADVKVMEGTQWGGTRWSTALKSTDVVGTTAQKWFCFAGDTGWIDIVFTSGWSQYPGYDTCQYRRLNGLVFTKGLATGGVAPASIFYYPVGFRPYATGNGIKHIITGVQGTWGFVNVQGDGRVNYNASGATPGWVTLEIPPFPAYS